MPRWSSCESLFCEVGLLWHRQQSNSWMKSLLWCHHRVHCFCLSLLLLGIGLLFIHTQVFKILECTSVLITSHELSFSGEMCTFNFGICVEFCWGKWIENWMKFHPAWLDGMHCKCTEPFFFSLSFSQMGKVEHYLQCVRTPSRATV